MKQWHDETFELNEAVAGTRDPDPAGRTEALRSIIKNAPEEAGPILTRMASHDPDRSLRIVARNELLRLKEPRPAVQPEQRYRSPAKSTQGHRAVIILDWIYAFLFGLYTLLHVLVPALGGEGAVFHGSIVRFAADSLAYNLLATSFCLVAAGEYKSQGLPGSVAQFFAAAMILPSFPAGPMVGAFMIYQVLRPAKQ